MTKKSYTTSEKERVNKERKIKEQPPGIPGWVKVSGVVAFSIVLLIVIIMLITGGQHGPGRHLLGENGNGQIEKHEIRNQSCEGIDTVENVIWSS